MDELLVVAGSFMVFQLMFVLASPLLTALFCQGYGNVVPAKHTEWNSRLVSTVHAVIVGTFCLYILWFDDAVNKDPVWGEPGLVKLNVAITCGYLVYDLLLLARYWKTMGDGFFVCHHITALYAYGFVLPPSALCWWRKRKGGSSTLVTASLCSVLVEKEKGRLFHSRNNLPLLRAGGEGEREALPLS
ncbi:UNVERIFIED_CONTAM: hypothetical protein FKN15_041934 [Acipenser sinensis]